eukprot:15264050-Heterocapsa_arctica.AAC.1
MHKPMDKDRIILEEGDKKRQTIEESSIESDMRLAESMMTPTSAQITSKQKHQPGQQRAVRSITLI